MELNPNSVRTLYLLRHGKAHAFSGEDAARELHPRGVLQAHAVGKRLVESTLDRVVVSTAVRTRQTWHQLASELNSGHVEPEFFDELYDGSFAEILRILQNSSADIRSVLLVGHEPVISTLAARLADPESDSALLARARLGVPTATLCMLQGQLSSWSDLSFAGTPQLQLRGIYQTTV